MPILTNIAVAPGTSKNPQVTEYTAQSWTDTNRVHFPDGRLRSIDPWVDTTPPDHDILGGNRTIFGHQNTGGVYYLHGTNTRLHVQKNGAWYNMTPLQTSSVAIADSLDTTDTSSVITVNYTSHGLTDGDRIKLDAAVDVGGIAAASINKEHIITYVDADSFTIDTGSDATSTVSGGGGASTVIYKPIDGGFLDVSPGTGYGMGRFGVGLYGVAKTSATGLLQYPRIWSFAAFGNDVVMCPGDLAAGDGQKIYIWSGDTDEAPTVLSNAPTDCNYVAVVYDAVVALCGNRIDISERADGTVWTPGIGTNAYTADITRTRQLIACVEVGNFGLIYSENEVLLLEWVNEPNYWNVDGLVKSDGLIGPNASVVIEETAYWTGKRGFYRFSGAGVEKLPNQQNEDWIFDNINAGQQWKCFAAPDTKYEQVWFHFPTGDSNEPSDYVIANLVGGHWTLGKLARTAAQRNGFVNGKYYMAYGDSEASAGSVYRHFADSNNDLALGWYAETNYAYANEGNLRFRIDSVMPDTFQTGDITLTIKTKEWPQDATEYSAGPYTLTATTPYTTVSAAGRVRQMRFEQSGTGASASMGLWKEAVILQGSNS